MTPSSLPYSIRRETCTHTFTGISYGFVTATRPGTLLHYRPCTGCGLNPEQITGTMRHGTHGMGGAVIKRAFGIVFMAVGTIMGCGDLLLMDGIWSGSNLKFDWRFTISWLVFLGFCFLLARAGWKIFIQYEQDD